MGESSGCKCEVPLAFPALFPLLLSSSPSLFFWLSYCIWQRVTRQNGQEEERARRRAARGIIGQFECIGRIIMYRVLAFSANVSIKETKEEEKISNTGKYALLCKK